MNFRPDLIARIYSGSPQSVRDRVAELMGQPVAEQQARVLPKTQTRRRGETQVYEVGQRYVIRAGDDAGPEVGSLIITTARQQALGDATAEDCRREGFSSKTQFIAYWQALYGAASLTEMVWVYDFDLVEQMPFPFDAVPEYPGLTAGV